MDDITRGISTMNVEPTGRLEQSSEMPLDLMQLDGPVSMDQQQQQQQQQHQQQQQQSQLAIMIATNVDPALFTDQHMQSHLESLVRSYDQGAILRYLKSFRRIRLEFTDHQAAERVRQDLNNYRLGNTELKIFSAHIIGPSGMSNNSNSSNNNLGDFRESNSANDQPGAARNTLNLNSANNLLNIPKPTKQFLISPPASPPVGWEPVAESSPCIDVQLISAIANLVPGETHEIHPGNESQPGIFVEVCEEPQFERAMRSCSRLPRTMSPAFHQAT